MEFSILILLITIIIGFGVYYYFKNKDCILEKLCAIFPVFSRVLNPQVSHEEKSKKIAEDETSTEKTITSKISSSNDKSSDEQSSNSDDDTSEDKSDDGSFNSSMSKPSDSKSESSEKIES